MLNIIGLGAGSNDFYINSLWNPKLGQFKLIISQVAIKVMFSINKCYQEEKWAAIQ